MKRAICLLIIASCILASLGAFSVQAADQVLPAADWYTVLWDRQADMLYWVSVDGMQASISRPKLPNEAPDATPDFRFSYDGRYMVLAAKLTNQLNALGIYDLASGSFIQVHQAQAGETIHLGDDLIFNEISGRVAVGFSSGTYENPAWRLIVFELATGNPVHTLSSTDPSAPAAPLSIPSVVYYTVNLAQGQTLIHFHLIPQGVGGSLNWSGYIWYPDSNTVTESPYTSASADIMYLTGEIVDATYDANYGQLPQNGPAPSLNAIGRGYPENALNTVWVDGTSYNFNAKWAANGTYILYYSESAQGVRQWNTIEATGTPAANNRFPFDPGIMQVAGTVDGYIFINSQNQVYFTNGFTTNTAPLIYTAPAPVEIAYVTPMGLYFTLPSVGDSDILALPPANPPVVNPPAAGTCPGAPPIRVQVNAPARVTITDGVPLRLRDNPAGNIMTQLAEGTEFMIIGGPQCLNNTNWWQISRPDPTTNAALIGWVAEGDSDSYYIELWTPANAGNNPPTGNQQGGTLPPAIPPVINNPPVAAGDGNCSLAPTSRLSMGQTATTATTGTLAMRINITDELPTHQIPGNLTVTIVGGPQCHKGYRMWEVTTTLSGQTVRGWISEGTTSAYFMNP